jgi:hypothetical protein
LRVESFISIGIEIAHTTSSLASVGIFKRLPCGCTILDARGVDRTDQQILVIGVLRGPMAQYHVSISGRGRTCVIEIVQDVRLVRVHKLDQET